MVEIRKAIEKEEKEKENRERGNRQIAEEIERSEREQARLQESREQARLESRTNRRSHPYPPLPGSTRRFKPSNYFGKNVSRRARSIFGQWF